MQKILAQSLFLKLIMGFALGIMTMPRIECDSNFEQRKQIALIISFIRFCKQTGRYNSLPLSLRYRLQRYLECLKQQRHALNDRQEALEENLFNEQQNAQNSQK